jgi:hypothetical protein
MARSRQHRPHHRDAFIVISCTARPRRHRVQQRTPTRRARTNLTPRCMILNCISMADCARARLVLVGQPTPSPGRWPPLSLSSKLVPSAPQVRLVSTKQAHCLKPSTSHGARARHPRLPQATMTSDARPAVGAQHAPHLQRLGAAARRPAAPGEAAERRRDVARPYGRGCGAQVACGECGVARLCVSRRTVLVALWEKLHMCRPLYL